jgi:hypothetical protein
VTPRGRTRRRAVWGRSRRGPARPRSAPPHRSQRLGAEPGSPARANGKSMFEIWRAKPRGRFSRTRAPLSRSPRCAGSSIGGRRTACAAVDGEWFQPHAPYDAWPHTPLVNGECPVGVVRWRSRRRRPALLNVSRSSLIPPQPHSAVHRPSYLGGKESRSRSSDTQSPT